MGSGSDQKLGRNFALSRVFPVRLTFFGEGTAAYVIHPKPPPGTYYDWSV